MLVDRGEGYGDLIAALLVALDVPEGREVGRWFIRRIEERYGGEERKPGGRERPHGLTVCVSIHTRPGNPPP